LDAIPRSAFAGDDRYIKFTESTIVTLLLLLLLLNNEQLLITISMLFLLLLLQPFESRVAVAEEERSLEIIDDDD